MIALYLCAFFYAIGTLFVLASLYNRHDRLQQFALGSMILGFAAHTVWTGIICTRTGHPPLTNLPEAAAFIAWTIFAVELILFIRYRVHAAAFFVYPLVLMLISISVVVGEPFKHMSPGQRSNLFVTHLLLTTVGIAALLVGLAFLVLFQIQQRALKKKSRGAFYDWIPSLKVCDTVSYRALAVGFGVYTVGILAGIAWAYRRTEGLESYGAKEVGALIAWMVFAGILQSYFTGTYRTRRSLILAAAAFVSITVAILGIRHG